jgi:hypothetical protein
VVAQTQSRREGENDEMKWKIRFFGIAMLGGVLGITSATGREPSPSLNVVNVKVTGQRRMMVEVRVDGVNGNFMVDTGAGNSYMGERFADSMGMRRSEGGYTYNVLGAMRFDVADVNSLELGANRVPVSHGLIYISNLAWANRGSTNPAAGNGIHGIIGADTLIRNQAVIDCGHDRIYFGNSGAQDADSPRRVVSLVRRRGDEIAVVVRVNGAEGLFIVDTGFNVSLLAPEFAYGLRAGRPEGGGSRSRVVRVTSLELGMNRLPARLGQMVVSGGMNVANQGYMDQGEAPYDGVIGMDFLINNHAVIDCKKRQLRFD